ncbi:MAG: hypothetical protein ACRC0V_04460 [Fusobacteriaceae bacterium]
MEVVMSIKKQYSDLMLSGEKTVELRRVFNGKIKKCYIYESRGCGKVVGEFEIAHISCNDHDWIGAIYQCACINKEDFIKYSRDRKLYHIFIKNVIKYDIPKTLEEFGIKRAPQNYCFIQKNNIKK